MLNSSEAQAFSLGSCNTETSITLLFYYPVGNVVTLTKHTKPPQG